MDLGLKGKTVIVTGGNKNIGLGVTLAFAREGANVVVAARDEETGQKAAEEAKKEGSSGTLYVKTDITQYDQVKAMVEKTLEQFKQIDVLINNAGLLGGGIFVETTPDVWDKSIDVNFKGMLNCCHLVLPHMIERKAGAIVNISSDSGRMGEFRGTVYAGAKAAEIAAGMTLAREGARYGIRVNTVCPSMTRDEGKGRHAAPMDPERLEKILANYPLRRLGTPEDTANIVAFLASDRASWITGQTLSVNGGYFISA